MPRKPSGRPNGRPIKTINWETFEELCWIQCTLSEIASVLKLNIDTVEYKVKQHYGSTFSEVYKKYSEGGKTSLRRYQFKQAEKNASMAIWLGKIWLKQSDKDEVKELAHDVIKQAVRELQTERGISAISRPVLENQSSLLDQGQSRQSHQIQSQLGTASVVGEQSSMQDRSESSSVRYNDVFLPPLS